MPATEPSDIQGLNYFDKQKPLLARLHEVGTERDKADRVRATCRDALRFLCLFVFFVASKNANCAWLFSSHKETQEDTKKYEERAADVAG